MNPRKRIHTSKQLVENLKTKDKPRGMDTNDAFSPDEPTIREIVRQEIKVAVKIPHSGKMSQSSRGCSVAIKKSPTTKRKCAKDSSGGRSQSRSKSRSQSQTRSNVTSKSPVPQRQKPRKFRDRSMNKQKRKQTKKTGGTRLRKLDTRSLKEKWLASLASGPLSDLKPRNRAVHNYSKVNFSKRATEVLGLGFKFRPTLKPPKQDDLKSQFNAFCRSVRLNTLFTSERSIDKDDYNPRLYVKSDWNPPRSDLVLESNLRAIWYDLSLNLFY